MRGLIAQIDQRLKKVLTVDVVEAIIEGASISTIRGGMLECSYRLLWREGTKHGCDCFEFVNKLWQLGYTPLAIAAGMSHKNREIGSVLVLGDSVSEASEVAVVTHVAAGDLIIEIVGEDTKIKAHLR